MCRKSKDPFGEEQISRWGYKERKKKKERIVLHPFCRMLALSGRIPGWAQPWKLSWLMLGREKKEHRVYVSPKSHPEWRNILYSVVASARLCINNEKLRPGSRGRDKSPATATKSLTSLEFGLIDSSIAAMWCKLDRIIRFYRLESKK